MSSTTKYRTKATVSLLISGRRTRYYGLSLELVCSCRRMFHELMVCWSNNQRLGKNGESCSFPLITNHNGCSEDLRIIRQRSAGTAEKLFTPRLHAGFCGLHFPSVNESVTFHFDVELVPYVGLWLCHGGWPTRSEEKHFTVALEPCNGRSDSLAQANSRKECPVLDPGACHRWTLQIQLCTGIPNSESRPEL